MQSNLLEQQGSLRQALDRLIKDHERLHINTINKPKELADSIVDGLENLKLKDQLPDRNLPEFQRKGHADETEDETCSQPVHLPEALAGWLKDLQTEILSLNDQIQILETLYFPQIFERVENIKDAHHSTFEWLFGDTEDSLEPDEGPCIWRWLQYGSKTFWVSGKAGSGKSTLMKFFHKNWKTRAALKNWAAGKKLIVASFFFWHAGTAMQKSQQGLLQTLLGHILRQAPALIPLACPSRWQRPSERREPWNRAEIAEAFSNIQKSSINSKFCFFIDGLDEYDGDHLDLIQVLESLISGDFAKLCFSSRPWNVFETYYGENGGQKLQLQDLTHDDIVHFAHDKLAEGTQFSSYKKNTSAYKDLVREIASKADGVFLWVFLVVRSLRRGMTNRDTPKELQARLQELPPDLEKFFKYILDSSEPIYRRQAARLYLIQSSTTESALTTYDLSFFAEDEPDFGLCDESVREYLANIDTVSEQTRIRVHARCQDLLEFDGTGHLRFLHRTVKDFLEIRDIKAHLQSLASPEFNAHRFVCNSSLIQLRSRAFHPESLYTKSTYASGRRSFTESEALFWDHICQNDTDDQWTFQLLYALDRVIWMLTNSPTFNVRWRKLCDLDGHSYQHYEGWLAGRAADRGYDHFLNRSVGSVVKIISADGDNVSIPPLMCVLEYMRFSLTMIEDVSRLLDLGADPNEISESGISVWHSYLSSLDGVSTTHTTIKLLEILLRSGAEPDVSEETFDKALAFVYATKDDITRLKDLRESLVIEKQHRHQSGVRISPRPLTPTCQLPKRHDHRKQRTESRRESPYPNPYRPGS